MTTQKQRTGDGFKQWTDEELLTALTNAGSMRGAYRLLTGNNSSPTGRFRRLVGEAQSRARSQVEAEPVVDHPSPEQEVYRSLRPYATPEQRQALDGLVVHGSVAAVAEFLKVTPSRVRGLLSEAKRRASRAGWAPEHGLTHTVPEGYHVAGVSTYYGPDGEQRGQWVKSHADPEHQLARLLDALQTIVEPLRGKAEATPPPQHQESDLLAAYLIGDPHFGMFAWESETGASFDLKIAEATLTTAIEDLVERAPNAEQALIVNVGDFFHTDNATNRTARSGNILDVDTRWAKVLSVGVRAMRWCIDRALQKHQKVRVINEIGNHDDHTAIVLSTVLAAFYEREPRVEIDCSPSPFHWYRFGKCLIGVTHGSEAKVPQLAGIMAVDRADDWGQTSHRRWYTGHLHHEAVTEAPGVVVETLRAMAPQDAWSHRAGYRAGRDMKVDVWHRERGLIARNMVYLGYLSGGQNQSNLH